jgi:peptide/nickel transport system permease protein
VVLCFIATSLAYILAAAVFNPKSQYEAKNPPLPRTTIVNELNARNQNPDKPIVDRYVTWVSGAVQGDFGKTYDIDSVNKQFGIRAWVTVRLVTLGTLVGAVLGILLGAYVAVRQYKAIDHTVTFASYIILAMPVFVLAPILKIFAVQLNKAVGADVLQYQGEYDPRATGFWAETLSRGNHLILPTISLAIGGIVFYSRYQRSTMLDVLGSDFLRTARAKGLRSGRAILKHGVRTAVIPVMTLVAFGTITTFTGAIITESVFTWHGLGEWFTISVNHDDANAVAVVTLFSAFLVLLASMASDIVTAALDPRVRL